MGGYILLGRTYGVSYVMKINETGNPIWNMTLKGYAGSVTQSWEGGFIVAGATEPKDANTYPRDHDVFVLSGYEGELPIRELSPLGLCLTLLASLLFIWWANSSLVREAMSRLSSPGLGTRSAISRHPTR